MNYNYNQYYTQMQYIPLTFINGIEGAKAFIVTPNQTVYLRDSDSDTLFIKSADAQGRYNLTAYRLVPIEDNKNKSEFATIDSFKSLEEKVNKLSIEIEKLTGGAKNEQ